MLLLQLFMVHVHQTELYWLLTKRGKKGTAKINYSGYVGFRKYTNLPDMMSGDEYVQLARESVRASNNNVYKSDSEIFYFFRIEGY